jgi:dTDP-4-amino-4,6-dideoxygalactose transaminase
MSPDLPGGPPVPHSRPELGEAERLAVLGALGRSWVGAGGEEGRKLEAEVAAAFGRPSAVAVSSGSAALEVALRVTGVDGAPVAVPAFACACIERAVVRAGGRPYLVDADPCDLSFPPGTLTSLAGTCRAAIVVHQFGLPAACAAEAATVPMTVIEDITTCAGGRIAGQAAGSFGRLTVMSFAATKLVCGGEGGVLAGSRADMLAARQWTDPESDLPPDAPVPHAKLSDLASALARVQFARLDEFVSRRAEIARRYDETLGPGADQVLRAPSGWSGTWWRYLVRTKDADGAVARARECGVSVSLPVPARRWAGRGEFPVADRLRRTLVSVPIFPALTESEIASVRHVLTGLTEVRRLAGAR